MNKEAEKDSNPKTGHPKIDWAEAFLVYAGFAPGRRSYKAVADRYADVGLSVRSVERHGREERWRERASELDREAAAAAAARLRDERTDRLVDTGQLVDASLLVYDGQLREGTVKLTATDLVRLHKLRTDIREDVAVGTPEQAEAEPASAARSAEHKLEVLRALSESGVLQRLLEGDQPAGTGLQVEGSGEARP